MKQLGEDQTRRSGPGSAARVPRTLDTASAGLLAAVELLRATGEPQYAETAVKLARTVMSHQQRDYFADLKKPLAGFFWESPAKKHILHHHHLSFMQAPILALSRLAEALPAHRDWIHWYASVVLYSEYLKKVARYTAPFQMLPESLYRDDEYLRLPEGPATDSLGYRRANRRDFQEQVLNGVKLGANHYLRLFPVWFNRRGNHGILLRQTKALAVAAHLRGDLEASRLAEKQLQWVVGRNPFSQSTMTGEGYDFVPHYTAMSGDIVGSLPVGFQTLRNSDVPYWPVHNYMNPKETWVHPVTGWIWSIRELGGPGLVTGYVDPGSTVPVRFRDASSGEITEARANLSTGGFQIWLPQGSYEVFHDKRSKSVSVLPGGILKLDLRMRNFLDFTVSYDVPAANQIRIQVEAQGVGEHRFKVLCDNVALEETTQSTLLETTQSSTLIWKGTVQSSSAPWIAVVIPDGDMTQRQEIVGWYH
jgi:hypothetical protein